MAGKATEEELGGEGREGERGGGGGGGGGEEGRGRENLLTAGNVL